MYLMMRAIGEMLYMDPDQHYLLSTFITKYLGKGLGEFFSGWSYWVSLIFLGMAEITAVSTYVQYWFLRPAWQIQIVFLIILSSVNLIAVKIFGKLSFGFGMIKIVTILALSQQVSSW